MPKIHWPQLNKTLEVAPKTSILDAAIENDIPLEHVCGGYCSCTTCHVLIVQGSENLSIPDEDEKERLGSIDQVTKNSRLGCQAKVLGDVTVQIPE